MVYAEPVLGGFKAVWGLGPTVPVSGRPTVAPSNSRPSVDSKVLSGISARARRVPQTPRDPMQSPASTSGQPNGTHTRNLYDSIDDDYGAPDSSRSRGKGGKPRATGGSNKSSQNTSPYHTARSHIEREEAAVYAQAGPAPRTTTDSQTSPAPAPARPSASHMGQAGRAAFAAFTAAAKAAAVDAEAAARSRRTTAATLGDGNSDTCVSPARGVITPPTSNHVTPTNATATNHSNRSSNSQLRAQQQQAASSSHNQGPGAYTRGESFSSVGKGGCSTPGLTANDSATSSKRFPTVPQPPVTRKRDHALNLHAICARSYLRPTYAHTHRHIQRRHVHTTYLCTRATCVRARGVCVLCACCVYAGTQSHSMWAVHIEQGAQNLEGVLGPLVEAMVVDSGVSDTLPDTPWSALVRDSWFSLLDLAVVTIAWPPHVTDTRPDTPWSALVCVCHLDLCTCFS